MLKKKKIRITSRKAYEVLKLAALVNGKDYGECRKDTKQILVSMIAGNREAYKTLIHEILHAIEFEYDIKISHALIRKLEEPIYRVLKLNGWI